MIYDFLVIGGGIAGASVAQVLATTHSTLLLERESQPGYHSTGRSAAVFAASYGPAPVRALTRASHAFLRHPPVGFAEHPLLSPRGALFVAEPGQHEAMVELATTLAAESSQVRLLSAAACRDMFPVLRPEQVHGAVWDPEVCDIDVHALHQGFLRAFRAAGGHLQCNAEVRAISAEEDHWCVDAGTVRVRAHTLVNAAGAWCDEVAGLAGIPPLGLIPKRRSAFVFASSAGHEHQPHLTWPMVIGVGEDWYLKPEGKLWLGSPANADPTVPQDVQPEEWDIAMGMHRVEEMTTLTVGRPQRAWAGLRSFFADGIPVAGFDPLAPGFFWLAGQGGYGIQTAPALGLLAATLARGEPLPNSLMAHGVTAQSLSVERIRRQIAPPLA